MNSKESVRQSRPDRRSAQRQKRGQQSRLAARVGSHSMYPPNSPHSDGSSLDTGMAARARSTIAPKVFSDFAIAGAKALSKSSRVALRAVYPEMTRAVRQYDKHVQAVLSDPRLSRKSRIFLEELWCGENFDQPLTMANRHVREGLTKSVMVALLRMAERKPSVLDGPTRLRMFTTSPDVGITPADSESIAPDAVGRHSYQAMRKAGLTGLGFLDVALFHEADDEPRWLAVHDHMAVRGRSPEFKPNRAMKAASPAGGTRNKLGGKVVKLSRRCRYDGLHRIAYLAYYVSKLSCGTKVFWKKGEQRKSKTTLEYWGAHEALRMLEAYSHIDALAEMRAIGPAKRLRKRVKELLRRNLMLSKLPRGARIKHKRLTKQWTRLYGELGLQWQPLSPR